jgi:FkbM family methyltransferase
MRKVLKALQSVIRDIVDWRGLTADASSWFRVVADIVWLKVGGAITNDQRQIRLKGGTVIHYRLNKGDLWSMREVLRDECYRFPGDIHPDVIVDLGGNIGLTSMWLHNRYKPRKIVVLEPSSDNARIARENLSALNDVVVIEAAVGSTDGYAHFAAAEESNKGAVSFDKAGSVRVMSMNTLIKEVEINGPIDLLKVDIEGGEAELFSQNLEWLDSVEHIITEFHPDVIDVVPIRQAICSRGFRHIPPGSVFETNMEAFAKVRPLQH